MSREITFRYLADEKVKKALVPEIVTASFRLESLAEKILEAKTPEQHEMMLREIIDGCTNIRCCAERL